MIRKFRVISFVLGLIGFFVFLFSACAYAKEITVVLTGDTHAMLYHCNCPFEPDGGLSRRATLFKELRKTNPDMLLLDSGRFFAGGLLDENTQNTQLDMLRTQANVSAMGFMGYDAVNLAEDEFNFGWEFLEKQISERKIPFVSSNLEAKNVLPFVVKDIQGLKVGIIGVTSLLAKNKISNNLFTDPYLAVTNAVVRLRQLNADIIIVLSSLSESEDLGLIKSGGIDILISGRNSSQSEPVIKTDATYVLRPFWQGRRIIKSVFSVEGKRIVSYKSEEIRVSDKYVDDPEVAAVVPRCFSDNNCQQEGSVGVCFDAGLKQARCEFTQAPRVSLKVIVPGECRVCYTDGIINGFKKIFPGLTVTRVSFPSQESAQLIKDMGINALPAYLFEKSVENNSGFNAELSKKLELKSGYYILKQEYSGISYLLGRKLIKGKLDIFISLYDKNISGLLEAIADFHPEVHFLAIDYDGKFDAAAGKSEVEEYLRAECVRKYYPKSFWDYTRCRANNIDSSWWEDCAVKMNTDKIKSCARGKEGAALLKEQSRFNKEYKILLGPAYLMDNVEIFSTKGAVTKEELKKVLKR